VIRRRTVLIASLGLGLVMACKPGGLAAGEDTGTSTTNAVDETGSSGTTASESTTDDSTTDDGTETGDVPPCEPRVLEECWSGLSTGLSACMEGCPCDNGDCIADCHELLKTNYWDCVDQHCQEPWSDRCVECYSTQACNDFCDAQLPSCSAGGCDSDTCNYQRRNCNLSCYTCINLYLEYEWADSCEIALPGPPNEIGEPYVTINIGGEQWSLSEMGLGCGDPNANDVVWVGDSGMLLCGPACEAFAMTGVLEVQFGCPPG
jgi:hypothetical protein